MALGLHLVGVWESSEGTWFALRALGWHLVRAKESFEGAWFAFGLHLVLFRALGLHSVAFLPLGEHLACASGHLVYTWLLLGPAMGRLKGFYFAIRDPRLAIGLR